MSPLEIKVTRLYLGLGTEKFAQTFGVADGRIVRRYEAGTYPVPQPLARLVRIAAEGVRLYHALDRKSGAGNHKTAAQRALRECLAAGGFDLFASVDRPAS